MGTAIFSGNSSYQIDVDASVQSQNQNAKTSTIYWRVIVTKLNGSGFQSSTGQGNTGYADSNQGGSNDLWVNNDIAYNFINGQNTGSFTMAEGTFVVQHRPDGTAEYYVNGGLTLNPLGSASAGTGDRALPRLAAPPDAPTPISFSNIGPSSIGYHFTGNSDGGSPIREWQIAYGTDPNSPQMTVASDGWTDVGGLTPGTQYYFWSRGRNDIGWGPWSVRTSASTTGGVWVRVEGVWKQAIAWVKVDGVWRQAKPWVRVGGTWKQTK